MVSSVFNDSGTLFPSDASQSSADNQSSAANQAALYQDAYGSPADTGMSAGPTDTSAQSAYAAQNGFLPNVDFGGASVDSSSMNDASALNSYDPSAQNPAQLDQNYYQFNSDNTNAAAAGNTAPPIDSAPSSVDNAVPNINNVGSPSDNAQTISDLQAMLDAQSGNDANGIVKNSVFNQPLTNNPDVLDRAAKAFAQDTENMLTYMALMKSDSAQLTQISDQPTVLAMQAALTKHWGPMEEQTLSNLTKLGIDPDTTQQVAQLLQTLDQGLLTKPGTANTQPADAPPTNPVATNPIAANPDATNTVPTNTTQPDASQFGM